MRENDIVFFNIRRGLQCFNSLESSKTLTNQSICLGKTKGKNKKKTKNGHFLVNFHRIFSLKCRAHTRRCKPGNDQAIGKKISSTE